MTVGMVWQPESAIDGLDHPGRLWYDIDIQERDHSDRHSRRCSNECHQQGIGCAMRPIIGAAIATPLMASLAVHWRHRSRFVAER